MKMLKNKKGFTLIEVIVVLAVIGILAAVLTPMIIGYIRDAAVRRAEADVRTVVSAIQAFDRDLRDWPVWAIGTARQAADTKRDALRTNDGDTPDVGTGVTIPTLIDTIDNHLVNNVPAYPTSGTRKWAGPYLDKVNRDPWGNKYYVDVKGLQPAEISGFMPSFAVSAGPNKSLETAFGQAGPSISIGGDDIVHRIK